jgi:hypothetical protein
MNMLDLDDFRESTWPCGNFEEPFWELKHWKLGILCLFSIGNSTVLG